MKSFLFMLTLVLSHFAVAQSASVVGRFDAQSRIPGVLIPYELQGAIDSVQSATVNVDAGQDCRIMKDPYINNIYLLKCSVPAKVTLVFKLTVSGHATTISYGKETIDYPSGYKLTSTAASGTTAGGGSSTATSTETAVLASGQQLYANNCVKCHGAASGFNGKSAALIKSKIATVNQMAQFSSLSDSDLNALAAYLNTPCAW